MFLVCNPSHAWWTGPKNSHYLMTTRSHKLLKQVNLYHEAELRKGAGTPDLPKATLANGYYGFARQNYDSALISRREAENGQAAWRIASAFHYLQDAIDISIMFEDKYRDGIRNSLHDTLESWHEVMGYPEMHKAYWDTYNTELKIMQRSDLKQAVQRLYDKRVELAGSMRSIFDAIERRKDGKRVSDSDAKELTGILLKCIATLQVAQDLMLEQFVYRYEGQ